MAGPINIDIRADGSQAGRALDNVASRGQRMGQSIKKAAVPALAALGGIAKAGYDAAQAAIADQAAQRNLAQTLRTTTDATGRQVKANEAWIASQGKLLGVTDDELRPAIGALATATGSISKAQKLAAIAMDVSARRGVSLESVTKKLAKAQTTGSATALAQYGIKTKDAAGKTRELSEVMGELANKYRGSAAASANTAAGAQKKFQVQVGELQEQIGAGLLPLFAKLTSVGLTVVDFLSKNEIVAKALVIGLAALAVAILAVNAAMLLNPAVLVVAGLVALGVAIGVAYQRSAAFREVVASIGDFIRERVLPALLQFGQYLQTVVLPAVIATAQRIGTSLKPVLTAIGEFIQGSLIPTIQKVAAKFREWWPTIQQVTVTVVKAYGRFLEFAAAIAGKVLPPVIRFAGFLLRNLVPAILSAIETAARIIGVVIRVGAAFVDGVKDVAKFATAVARKIGEVLRTVAGIPGRVTAAIGDLGGLLIGAGRALIQGLIDGIGEMFGAVQNKLGDLTGKLTSWKGPPKRDAVLLRPAGRLIIQGLIDGFTDGAAGVKKSLEKITALIEKTINRRVKDDGKAAALIKARVKALRDEFAALTRNGRAQDRNTAQLDKAKDRLKALIKTSKDYAASVKSSIVSYGSIIGLGQNDDGSVSAAGLLDQLKDRLARAQRFAALIEQLRKKLNPTSLQALIDAGVDGGLATAEAIAAGGQSTVAQINQLTQQLAQTGAGLGSTLANQFNAAGINTAAALVAELKRKQKQLDAIAERMGNALAAAVRRGLGGDREGGGRTTGDAARALVSQQTTKQTVAVRFTADQMSDLQRGRSVRADVDVVNRFGKRTLAMGATS